MGFFSHRCSISKESIPAWPYAEFDKEESDAILLLPDGRKFEGLYGGYGDIGPTSHFIYDIGAMLNLGPNYKRLFFNGVYVCSIDKFDYEDKIELSEIKDEGECFIEVVDFILGMNMNGLNHVKGYTIETNFDVIMQNVKMVKRKYYNGETFDQLEVSPSCEHQGFFYDDDFDMQEDAKQFLIETKQIQEEDKNE